MIVDIALFNIVIILTFIFNTLLIYYPNTEWIGFLLFFVWNFLENVFLMSNYNFTDLSEYVTVGIGSFLLVSIFLISLSTIKLHSFYVKSSEPVKLSVERRLAFDRFKIIYIICQIILLLLVFFSSFYDIFFNNVDLYVFGFSIILFLSIWVGVKINENRKDTDIYPFICGFLSSNIVVFIASLVLGESGYIKSFKLLLLTSGITLSSYLVFLSNWIFRHSSYIII